MSVPEPRFQPPLIAPTVPPIPPSGPGRVAWYRQVLRAVADDHARTFVREVEAGATVGLADAIATARLIAFVTALEAAQYEAIATARWSA